MTAHKQIATVALLAALFTTSIAMAEPKGLQGNTFDRPAAVQAKAAPAPMRLARCDCPMMKSHAAPQTHMGMTDERLGSSGKHTGGTGSR